MMSQNAATIIDYQMRYSTILAFLCVTIPALAQNAFTRIAPDDAASHLIQALLPDIPRWPKPDGFRVT